MFLFLFESTKCYMWRRKWQPTPVFLLRGAWWAAARGVAQSWTWLKCLSMHACIGERTGNPLQCSCLENPGDRGAWWAAIYGVSQSWTRLKRLSSSSRCYMSASMMAQTVKNMPAIQETRVDSWVGKMPWRREWQITLVFFPGESHGQKSLVGNSPMDCKKLVM